MNLSRKATAFTHLYRRRFVRGSRAPIPPLFKGEGGRLAKPSGRVGCVAGEGPHPSRRFRGEPPSPAARGRDKRRPFYALRSSLGADPSPLQRGGWPIGEAKRTGGVRCRRGPPPVSPLPRRATLPRCAWEG